jgi:hypothetical protein
MTQYLVPVRKNKDTKHEWFDTSCMSLDAEQCRRWSAENEAKLPDFYKQHPVSRFAWVKLQEVA